MILENQLKEAQQEKSLLEKQYKQRLTSAENVAATQLTEILSLKDTVEKQDPRHIKELQSKLEQKEHLITDLQTKLSKLSEQFDTVVLQLKTEETLKLGEDHTTVNPEQGEI